MAFLIACLAASAFAAPATAQSGATATSSPFAVEDVWVRAPPPLDYHQQASWFVFASKGFTISLPSGASPAADASRVANFFVHPTTFRGAPGVFSQEPADAEAAKLTASSSIARQASAFNGCCSVYAPRYRAASTAGFASAPPIREAAFALAYSDIERAFAPETPLTL